MDEAKQVVASFFSVDQGSEPADEAGLLKLPYAGKGGGWRETDPAGEINIA